MFTLVKPTHERIAALRAAQSALAPSYAHVGSTRGTLPAGMTRDRNTVRLGEGDLAWSRARAAVRGWRMFEQSWIELHEPSAPIAVGSTVVVLVGSLGLWSANAARVAYVIDEAGAFGFAYVTLPNHVECGEEAFVVRRDAHGAVSFEIVADSRPRHPLARIAYPWTRRLQRRFARDALAAMRRATT